MVRIKIKKMFILKIMFFQGNQGSSGQRRGDGSGDKEVRKYSYVIELNIY